jgi:fructokinase
VWDVACLGELVIDLVPHSKSGGEWLYAPSPGGAPGNVAVGLAKLGRRVAMISKVAEDVFGNMIVSLLDRHGVDTSGVARTVREKTGLSVVSLGPAGDRSFAFYRDNPADLAIDVNDIVPNLVENSTLLHVGVLPMSTPRSAAAQGKAINLAKAAGRLISVDPNFRPDMWRNRDAMLSAGHDLVALADIVKLSEEELFLLTEGSSTEDAARRLWHKDLKVMAITKGAHGAELFTTKERFVCNGFSVEAIDTTAAGDAFLASLLSGFIQVSAENASHEQISHLLRSACAAGALATTKKGAMESIPKSQDIERLMKE